MSFANSAMFRRILLPRLVWYIYRLLYLTWRIEFIENPQSKQLRLKQQPIVYAHWHGDDLALLHILPRFHVAIMTSTSKDGQLIDYLIRKMGGVTSKGSSSRKAAQALKGLVRLGRKGYSLSMAVDGPKGPIYQVKSGVFGLSRLLNAPICPTGAYCKRFWLFTKSWDKAYLPHPFAKVVVVFGMPLPPVSKETDPRSPKLAAKLSQAIDDTKQQAFKIFANHLCLMLAFLSVF